jgi:hypothetical protein
MPHRKAGEPKFHNNNNDYTTYLKEEVEGENLPHLEALNGSVQTLKREN